MKQRVRAQVFPQKKNKGELGGGYLGSPKEIRPALHKLDANSNKITPEVMDDGGRPNISMTMLLRVRLGR